jgi:hypothetical protein
MKKSLILVFISVLTLTACRTDSAGDQRDNLQSSVNLDTTRTAIVPWEKSNGYPFDNLSYSPATLTAEELEQLEKSLIKAVTDYNNSLSPGHEEYKIDLKGKEYKKQLVVVINSKAEKEVWVNCFCDKRDESWRTEFVVVHDGGPCYFNFKLNLATNEVYDFSVNGFA